MLLLDNESSTYFGVARKFESGFAKHADKRLSKFLLNLWLLGTDLFMVNEGLNGMKPTAPAIFRF